MTDASKDFLFWKACKGRYSEGSVYAGAATPREGGDNTNEYREYMAKHTNGNAVHTKAIAGQATAVSFSRPLGMNWGNGSQMPPAIAEPVESVEPVGYTQVTMTRDPFTSGYKTDAPDDTPAVSVAAAVADLPDFAPAVMIRI